MISSDSFKLDNRITKHLEDRMQENLDLTKRKMEFEVEKSKVLMEKMLNHFIKPLGRYPIVVKGIFKDIEVECIRQKAIEPEFDELMKEVDRKIIEAEKKGR